MNLTKELRQFGITVGGIFSIIGLWPLLHQQNLSLWALIPGALLLASALIYPRILYWPNRSWQATGHALGWVNSRIILGIIFYGIFTPLGRVMTLFGYDPLKLGFDKKCQTYKIAAEKKVQHMERQF